jgi:hypothetical protein
VIIFAEINLASSPPWLVLGRRDHYNEPLISLMAQCDKCMYQHAFFFTSFLREQHILFLLRTDSGNSERAVATPRTAAVDFPRSSRDFVAKKMDRSSIPI